MSMMTLTTAKALAFTAGETFKTARGLAKFGDDALPLAQSSFKTVGAAVKELNTRAAQGAIGGRVNFASDAHKAMTNLLTTIDSGAMPGVAAVTSAQARVDLLVRAVLKMP
jgi:phage-related protein